MNETNQMSCEAVESSCEQVTPDSNQDKSLSLMRYKDLQQLAMSLNLPGNLKRKTLVDLITAKRSNRDEAVEMIINEHRVSRKPVVKRPRELEGARFEESEDGCAVASHFMEPSGSSDYGPLVGEGSASSSARKADRPRKKRGGEVATASSAPPTQGPLVAGEMQNAYVAQVAYPYRYTLQASPAIALPKGILASILSGNGSSQALNLNSHLRCNTMNNYGIVSSVSNNNNISNNQFTPSTETDNYKYMSNPQLSSNFSSLLSKDSGPSTQESSQGDHMYSAIHQPPQLTSESNYVSPYAISHPTYATLTHYTNIPSSHAHLQQPSFTQPESGGNLVCFGYPQQTDTSPNEVMNQLVGKQSVAHIYGQKVFTNQRMTDNGYAVSPLDDSAHKHGSHMPYAMSPSPALSNNTAKCWENGSVTSTSTASQDMHKKCQPVFGNINAIWHYQGLPLNYNNSPASPSVVAHDLTVPSRRAPQESTLGNSSLAKGPIAHSENPEEKATYLDYSEAGASSSFHQPRIDQEVENSCEKPSTHSGDLVHHAEQSHSTESMPQMQQSLQCYEEKIDGTPSPAEPNSTKEGVGQGGSHSTQLSNSQVNVHEASECSQEPISRDVQHMSYSEEANMSYWNNMYPSVKNNHSPHYSSGFNAHCVSVYGVVPPNGNPQPCSECDIAKYSHHSSSYQTLVSSNSCLSSPNQSAHYNHSMGVGYDYRYGQRPYGQVQNSYSPYSGQENGAEIDSTNISNDNADGYLQEQPNAENYSRSYVTPNSMESMWSSAQSSSNEFENPLVASSPVGNELEEVQDSCMEGVFPDEGDLEMEDEQGLAFPNIYDYVMGSAEGEAESALSAKMGEEANGESDDCPTSPGSSCGHGKKGCAQDETFTEGLAESACEESDCSKNDSESLTSPSKDLLNESGSSTMSGKSSAKRRNSSSLDTSLENDRTLNEKGTPVVALKRRSQSSRVKSSKMHHHRIKGGKGGRNSSPRRSGSRGKIVNRKDIISCPCDQGSCTWVGRIPAMASHIRSAHQENVVSADDTSYVVNIKELNQRNHSTFFQETGGTLYLIAMHKKEEQVITTIQSLPGSGRSGIHLNGTKASLEVLLKDGSSQGWRGRVWSILAPPAPNSQKTAPHSPASLQERLWSRGDYLSVELNNICDITQGAFHLYVSITPGQANSLNSSYTDDDTSCKIESGLADQPVEEPSDVSSNDPVPESHESTKLDDIPVEEEFKAIPSTSSSASSSNALNSSLASSSSKASNSSSSRSSSSCSTSSLKSLDAGSSSSAISELDKSSKSESTVSI